MYTTRNRMIGTTALLSAVAVRGGSQRSAPQVTEAKVTHEAMLTHVITAANTARTAGLSLCYSAAGMIVLMSHLTDPKDDKYKSRADAVEYVKDEVRKATGVKNRMLDQYVNVADTLAAALIGSAKMFSATIQEIGSATKPEQITEIIHTWFDTNKGKRTETMQDLNIALGYAAPKDKGGNAGKLTPTTAVERVDTLFSRVQDITGHGKGKLEEEKLAAPIMSHIKSKGDFLVEAIKNVFDKSALQAARKAIDTQLKTLEKTNGRLSEAAAENVKTPTGNARQVAAKKAAKTRVKNAQANA